jgi:hypothetical protein
MHRTHIKQGKGAYYVLFTGIFLMYQWLHIIIYGCLVVFSTYKEISVTVFIYLSE